MRTRQRSAAMAAVCVGLLLAAGSARTGSGDVGPGSYCPLPEPGQRPQCLVDAKAKYGADMFEALDDGDIRDDQLHRLEADVAAGSDSDHAYLALSSLTYAYYRMAQQAAAAPGEDPAVVARLERWNELLAGAFDASPDEEYRDAMRTAAEDLRDRAPDVSVSCVDESGQATQCTATELLIRSYGAAADSMGIHGALERIIQRVIGRDEP